MSRAPEVLDGTHSNLIAMPTVISSEVHKREQDNVWILSAREDAAGCLTVEVDPSRAATGVGGIIEVQRQSGILHAHRCANVDENASFILSEISLHASHCLANTRARKVQVSTLSSQKAGSQSVKALWQEFKLGLHDGSRAAGYARTRLVRRDTLSRLPQPAPPTRELYAAYLPESARFSVDLRSYEAMHFDHWAGHYSGIAIIRAIEHTVRCELPNEDVVGLNVAFMAFAQEADAVVSICRSRGGYWTLRGDVSSRATQIANFRCRTVKRSGNDVD